MTRLTTFAGERMEVSFPEGRPDKIDFVAFVDSAGRKIPADRPLDLAPMLDRIRMLSGMSALATLAFQVEAEIEAEEETTEADRRAWHNEAAHMEWVYAENAGIVPA